MKYEIIHLIIVRKIQLYSIYCTSLETHDRAPKARKHASHMENKEEL